MIILSNLRKNVSHGDKTETGAFFIDLKIKFDKSNCFCKIAVFV